MTAFNGKGIDINNPLPIHNNSNKRTDNKKPKDPNKDALDKSIKHMMHSVNDIAKNAAKTPGSPEYNKQAGIKSSNGDDDDPSGINPNLGLHFAYHNAAQIIQEALDKFILQVKPTSSNSGLLDLRYDYNKANGSQAHVKTMLKSTIPDTAQGQADYLSEQGKGATKIFNPDESMQPNPEPFMQFQGSFASFVKELSNAPFNEIYWTHADKSIATFNIRQTPFGQEDWQNLPSFDIGISDVTSMDIHANDAQQYSVFALTSKWHRESADNLRSAPPITDDEDELIARYGYNFMDVETYYFDGNHSATGLTQEQNNELSQQQNNQNDANAERFYPSYNAFLAYFATDSKNAKPQNIPYTIDDSYGGDAIYTGMKKALDGLKSDNVNGSEDKHNAIKKYLDDFYKAHPEAKNHISESKINTIIEAYNSAKGKYSKASFVQDALPSQENPFISTVTGQSIYGGLNYALTKGIKYITKHPYLSAQDVLIMSQGKIGSMQAWQLIKAYIGMDGKTTSDSKWYWDILKKYKHSEVKAHVTNKNTGGGNDTLNKFEIYEQRLFNFYADNAKFYSGNITVTGRVEAKENVYSEYGNRLYWHDYRRGALWEFYIESVAHNFDFKQGWTTTYGVTRGLKLHALPDPNTGKLIPAKKSTERWNMYWGHGVPFTGGFFGEMSYNAMVAAAEKLNSDSNNDGVNDSGDTGGDDSKDGTGSDGKWHDKAAASKGFGLHWSTTTVPDDLKKYIHSPADAGMGWKNSKGWTCGSFSADQCFGLAVSFFHHLWKGAPGNITQINGDGLAHGEAKKFHSHISYTPHAGAVASIDAGVSGLTLGIGGHTWIVEHVFKNGDIFLCEENMAFNAGGGSGSDGEGAYTWGYGLLTAGQLKAWKVRFFTPRKGGPHWNGR